MAKQDGCVAKELHNIIFQDGNFDISIEETQGQIKRSEVKKVGRDFIKEIRTSIVISSTQLVVQPISVEKTQEAKNGNT